jgi:hypothetical protein
VRIIERTNPINKAILYVVQDENFQSGMYNSCQPLGFTRSSKFVDVRSFATLQEARDFMYQATHSLMPGERVVT